MECGDGLACSSGLDQLNGIFQFYVKGSKGISRLPAGPTLKEEEGDNKETVSS